LTKALEANSWKKVDSGTISLAHEGKCQGNTVHDPAVAEEHAFAEDTCYLLLGDGGTQILSNNEAIFANDVVTDGDTRGAHKFIRVQASIIGPNSIACIINLVVQLPDIVLYLSHYDIMTHSHFDT
jgi:hypothetical protein